MPIIRGHHSFDDHFTQIPNAWIRDSRLSFKARGLLAEILSHRSGWSISLNSLAQGKDGKDAVRSAVNELMEFGYLSRSERREKDELGRMTDYVYTTHDPADSPTLDFPTLDNPTPKKNITKEEQVKEVNPHPAGEEDFEAFWEVYPKKVDKFNAKKAFLKAVKEHGAEDILKGAQRLAEDPNLPPRQFIPYPASWLRAGGWSNEPYAPRERSKEELRDIEAEKARKAREIERERSEALRAEMKAAKERATEAPDCEHGLPLWKCLPCCQRLAEAEKKS